MDSIFCGMNETPSKAPGKTHGSGMYRRRAAADQLLSRFGQLFPIKECPGIISRPLFAVFPLPLGQIFKIEEIRPAAFQKAAFGIKNCRCRIYLSLVWRGRKPPPSPTMKRAP